MHRSRRNNKFSIKVLFRFCLISLNNYSGLIHKPAVRNDGIGVTSLKTNLSEIAISGLQHRAPRRFCTIRVLLLPHERFQVSHHNCANVQARDRFRMATHIPTPVDRTESRACHDREFDMQY